MIESINPLYFSAILLYAISYVYKISLTLSNGATNVFDAAPAKDPDTKFSNNVTFFSYYINKIWILFNIIN
jgi:hypothetical protein